MLTNPGKHTSLYEIAELFGEVYNTVARLKKNQRLVSDALESSHIIQNV